MQGASQKKNSKYMKLKTFFDPCQTHLLYIISLNIYPLSTLCTLQSITFTKSIFYISRTWWKRSSSEVTEKIYININNIGGYSIQDILELLTCHEAYEFGLFILFVNASIKVLQKPFYNPMKNLDLASGQKLRRHHLWQELFKFYSLKSKASAAIM